MKLSIGKVLYLSFGAVLVVMMVASLIVWQKQSLSIGFAKEIANDDLPGVVYYLELLDEMDDMASAAMAYTLGQSSAKQDFMSNYNEFKSFHTKLVVIESATAESRELLDNTLSSVEAFKSELEQKVFNVYSFEKEQKALQLFFETRYEVAGELKAILANEKNAVLVKLDAGLSSENVKLMRYILELEDETDDLLASVGRYVAGMNNAQQYFYDHKTENEKYLNNLQQYIEPSVFNKIITLQQTIYGNAELIFTTLTPEAKSKAQNAVFDAKQKHLYAISDLLEAASDDEIREAGVGSTSLIGALITATNTLFITTFLAIVIGCVIAWRLSSSITYRLKRLTNQAGEIAKGNLSLDEIQITRDDELGELAISINDMQKALQRLIKEIVLVAKDVSEASKSLTHASQQINAGSQEQASKSHQIATASEEMTATVNEVAAQTQDAAGQASEAGRAAAEGGVVMNNAVQSSQRVADLMEEIANTVSSLGERSVEIGQIISVITSIAEQTNLLALNAAIEAARAGEAGRGFAVVADEVRGLAERTSKATKEVSDSITAIQKETDTAVSKMKRGTEAVSEGVEHSKAAGDALERIVELAAIVNDMIQSIAGAAEEQTAVTKEITQDITTISDIANDSVSQTAGAEQTAIALGGKVKQLENLIAEFKI